MGRADYLALGNWNVVCYQCGRKMKASMMERNWQGYYVCPEHNEPRQAQDFVRGVPDDQLPPWVQPRPSTTFTYTDKQLGISDGVQVQWQLGDGLYDTTVTNVKVNGSPVDYTNNTTGLITLSTAVNVGAIVTASGSEVCP